MIPGSQEYRYRLYPLVLMDYHRPRPNPLCHRCRNPVLENPGYHRHRYQPAPWVRYQLLLHLECHLHLNQRQAYLPYRHYLYRVSRVALSWCCHPYRRHQHRQNHQQRHRHQHHPHQLQRCQSEYRCRNPNQGNQEYHHHHYPQRLLPHLEHHHCQNRRPGSLASRNHPSQLFVPTYQEYRHHPYRRCPLWHRLRRRHLSHHLESRQCRRHRCQLLALPNHRHDHHPNPDQDNQVYCRHRYQPVTLQVHQLLSHR